MIQMGRNSMSNESLTHALDKFLEDFKDSHSVNSHITVEINSDLNFLNIRGSIANKNFFSNAERVFNQPLPTIFNTFTSGSHQIYWQAPDEWLLVTDHDLNSIIQEVNLVDDIYVSDQSGGLVQLSIQGPKVHPLLAKSCTLNLNENLILPGQCAQTGLAKAPVLIALVDATPQFNFVIRRSFAEYTALWLAQTGEEFGIKFLRKE